MKFLILGGTGTLGRELTRQLLTNPTVRLICFSRDELKQKQLAEEYKTDALRFRVGDIRDVDALEDAMAGVHTVFHVAALKHIDWLEENPEESVKTNVIGTMNVARAAERRGVRHVVFSSTDKAVDPINVYGMCKGVSEKLLFHRNKIQNETLYSVYRWGNVLGSRGSFIHALAKSLVKERIAYLTHAEMTRFWIRIEDAVKYVLSSYRVAPLHQPMLPKMKAAPVIDLVRVIAEILDLPSYKVKEIGKRPGEKLHEVLMSHHTTETVSSDLCERYTDEELKALLEPLVSHFRMDPDRFPGDPAWGPAR